MKATKTLQDLKVGDKITTYCYGTLVEAKVIQTDGIGVCVSHKPVIWGNTVCTETWVQPSTHLQKEWGSTDKDGKPTKGPETTPGAFYKGEPLKSPITR